MTGFKHMVRGALISGCVGLAACQGPFPAPPGAYLVIPDGYEIAWDITQPYNAIDDGYGVLLLLWFTVLDANNFDFPVNNVQVELLSGFEGAYLLPQSAILSDTSVPEGCDNGQYPEAECELWFGDPGTDFREIADGYVDIDNYHPTYMATTTDRRGVATAGLYIDTGMDDGYGFELYFNIGVSDEAMEVVFLGPEEQDTTDTTDTTETTDTGETTPTE